MADTIEPAAHDISTQDTRAEGTQSGVAAAITGAGVGDDGPNNANQVGGVPGGAQSNRTHSAHTITHQQDQDQEDMHDQTGSQENEEKEARKQAIKNHKEFCIRIGLQLKGDTVASSPGWPPSVGFWDPVKHGYYDEINRAYMWHSVQYWFVASLINTLHLSQIILGAIATALGSAGEDKQSKKRTTAITVLTTIITVIAALLTYFKSRGQPNRVRQLRNELRKTRDYIRFTAIDIRNPESGLTVEKAMKEVNRLYNAARDNAETNYPDTWSPAPAAQRPPKVVTGPNTRQGIVDAQGERTTIPQAENA